MRDAWAAGLYPFALVVALLSGAWPYAKLLLLLGCWWAPASLMPPRRCERLLLALDALGKWALLDFDMMMVMAVAFRLHLRLPAGAGGGIDAGAGDVAPLDVRVQVTPRFGLCGYLVRVRGTLPLALTLTLTLPPAGDAALRHLRLPRRVLALARHLPYISPTSRL